MQVLSRAALLLRALSVTPEGLTPIALADQVGLPRSTCYRIVGALCQEGLMRLSPSGKLHIGAGLISLAAAGRRDLRHESAPLLERLSLELHETVELVVLDGDEALFTDQYVPQRSLRVVAEVGDRFPLYCTACGKALLAELPDAEAARLVPPRLEPLTSHTIVDRDALFREVEEARITGVAYDHQEHTLGVSAVGAALKDAGGAMAAITVAMPAARLDGHEERISAALLRTRDDIQQAIDAS
ncbi:MAG TPA: IclR family transcriptional regulator [Thermoleophilia bacterium]|nr:IclR family transcriptional regulator [Thermoleophilia bacterium]